MTRPAAGQAWDADAYQKNAGFVADLGAPLLALLAVTPGEAVLDVGCGDGRLTDKIADSGALVTGLEPDPSLAAAARSRGLVVLEQDAHEPFGDAAFEAVISNAALHWMRSPEKVLTNIHRALKPGGRFVAEQGAMGNCAAFVTAIHAALEVEGLAVGFAWDFPSVAKQTRRLEAAGFVVDEISLIPRPTPLPSGMAGWIEVFAGPFLIGVDEETGSAVRADVLRRLEPVLYDETQGWVADYVRLRYRAHLPG